MEYEFIIRCMICGKERTVTTDSPIVNVKKLLKETGWARANLKLPDGKIRSEWICDECLKKLKVGGK